MEASHPVGQQEESPVLLDTPPVSTIQAVGIAVPLYHRSLACRKHVARLGFAEATPLRVRLHVRAVAVADVPVAEVERNLAESRRGGFQVTTGVGKGAVD